MRAGQATDGDACGQRTAGTKKPGCNRADSSTTTSEIMNALSIVGNTVATMTSVELVDFVNSERKQDAERAGVAFPSKGFAELQHKHFLAKVPEVIGAATSAKFSADLPDSYGRLQPAYIFPKREACLMAMSYSYDLQAKVFDRMTALEAQAEAMARFNLPKTYSEAMRLAADQADQIEAQQAQLAIAAPKAEALDLLTLAEGAMCITNAAKAVSKQPKALFSWLQTNDWIYRRPGGVWCAYQQRIKSGLLTHKVTTVSRSDGTEKIVEQVSVTAKGLAKLAEVAA